MNADGQIDTFLITVATGVFLGLLFDFYRVLRALYRPRWLLTSLADLLYWLAATGVVFLALLFGNWGELRLYVFIGLALGALGYYRLLSRQAVRLMIGALRAVAWAARTAGRIFSFLVVRPAGFVIRLATGPLRRLGGLIAARRRPPDGGAPPP
jgi:spore cortex biosynthesis protein YabQ